MSEPLLFPQLITEQKLTKKRSVVGCAQCGATFETTGAGYMDFLKKHVKECGPGFDRDHRRREKP